MRGHDEDNECSIKAAKMGLPMMSGLIKQYN
jgi:hypothetical protein